MQLKDNAIMASGSFYAVNVIVTSKRYNLKTVKRKHITLTSVIRNPDVKHIKSYA